MRQKIIIEVDHNLKEGEILQFKDGLVRSVEIHELLPDLIQAEKAIEEQQSKICSLRAEVEDLAAKVKELRGEDQ